MKPPIKNLIGGVKELHTGSICSKSQLEWCAVERDRKSPPRTARTQELEQNSCFLRERKDEEEDIPGDDDDGDDLPSPEAKTAPRLVVDGFSPLVGYPKWKVRCSVAASF